MKAKGDFAIAVQVLLSCARDPSERICSSKLAEPVGVHASRIRGIVARLVKGGLLVAHEGRSGGVQLKRPASKIDLEEVLRVVDPSPFIKIHETPKSSKCPVGCGMMKVMESVEAKVEESARRSLKAIKLDELLRTAVGG
jgi:Rrf2 family protein